MLGLYSERCGVTLYVGSSAKEALAVNSQLKIIGRPMYSVPPMHGAIIVERILTNPSRRALWYAHIPTWHAPTQPALPALAGAHRDPTPTRSCGFFFVACLAGRPS